MSLDPNTALASMATVLHNERVAVLTSADGDEKSQSEAALMWATACAQEAITIWRSVHPKLEREMLAELVKTSKG